MRGAGKFTGRGRISVIASALLATSTLAITATATPAMAQSSKTRTFNIPSQPLSDAIVIFNRQSGIQVTATGGLIAGRTSAAVQGGLAPMQALGALLAGTGLSWRVVDSNTVTLEPAPQASSDAIQLGTLRVEGAGGSATAAGSGGISSGADGMYADPFDVYKTPRAIAVVNRETLDRMPQTTPSDMFNAIPGVQMANAASSASFDPNIRGAQGHGRVKVLLDGSDSSQASRVTYAGNRQHNYVDPDFIAGISVEKGPGLESGGLGGTINMRTFNASDIITNPSRNWGVRVRGMLGDNSGDMDSTTICTQTRTYTDGRIFTYEASGTPTNWERCNTGYTSTRSTSRYTYTDVYAPASYSNGADVPSSNMSGSIMAAFRPADNFDIVAGYARRTSGNYSAGKNGDMALDYPNNGGYYFDGSAKQGFSYWQPGQEVYGTFTDTESYMAKARAAFGDHSFLLKFNHFESNYVLQANSGAQTSTDALSYFPPASHSQQLRYGLDYAFQPASDWVLVKADIWMAETKERLYLGEFGSSLTPQNTKTDTFGFGLNNSSSIPLFGHVATLKIGGTYKSESTDSDTEVNGVDVEQFGLFASLNLPVRDWLTLDGGLRYDDYKATLDPDQTYRFTENNSDSGTSLHGGVTIQPADPLQLFFRYAEGWRAPSARENTLNNCMGGLEPYQSGTNTYYRCVQGLVKPEQSRTIEYGANLALADLLFSGDRLGIKLTRFDNKLTDYIYGSGTSVLPIQNIPSASFVGYELSMSYDAGFVFVDYAYTNNDKAEFCISSWPTSTTPSVVKCGGTSGWGDLTSQYTPARHRHNATIGVRLLDRKLTIGGTGTFVRGTGWDYDDMRGYDVYDLFASYELGPVSFALSAENIGDRYYFEAGTGAAWPLPAAGRMVRGTITFKY